MVNRDIRSNDTAANRFASMFASATSSVARVSVGKEPNTVWQENIPCTLLLIVNCFKTGSFGCNSSTLKC